MFHERAEKASHLADLFREISLIDLISGCVARNSATRIPHTFIRPYKGKPLI
jgi:hypothetical protein